MTIISATIFRFLITVAAIPGCAYFMDGVHAETNLDAVVVGAILAVIFLALRPILRLILTVFNFCTLGLLNILLDAWLIGMVTELAGRHVTFDSFWWTLAVAVVLNVLRMGIDVLTGNTKK